MAGEGTYQCTLDDEALETAKRELNEDPIERASQIETLRNWVKQQPHLRARTDDNFLLSFLRPSKFSQLRAQEKLDNYYTMRSVPDKGVPEWFENLDPADPKLIELLEMKVLFPLPGRDDKGRKVVITTMSYDPARPNVIVDMCRLIILTLDILLKDEKTQVYGLVDFTDCTDLSVGHLTQWTRDLIAKSVKVFQDAYPIRWKSSNYYNTPVIFNATWEICKLFMKEKFVNRTHFHWGSLDSVYKEIPKRMLPEEYGGEAGPMEDIIREKLEGRNALIPGRDIERR
ncbi:alpha-tocopherol transfer protein-like isoform X2 [Lingula anatina]|uniref:Alpha-tocopherol transfer protein-like isoform X2 n=2 Tax=Lingula anatina TaxID=7574 RepID=A0A2R2MTP0_LINAN|nr:alpha-tocopherol transfer protein-like isoform X2 [Lingula anatina]|eukprot:XP_023933640.1 alpha-tocopherol transfer protein-like isoform X2 [Lingula anatina]